MAIHNEIEFENDLCDYLKSHGWLYSKDDTGYDVERALFPEDLLGWIQDTQPKTWERLKGFHNGKSETVALDRLVKVMETESALHAIRKGFKAAGTGSSGFELAQFKPAHGFNQEVQDKYAKNRLRIMRQVHYSASNRNSIDLVAFLNGIPVATLELKTDFTQGIEDAKNQYRTDRLPKDAVSKKDEPLLQFKRGALVHFAVSTSEVWMTTKLAGMDTYFLPFNQGYNRGKGNPPNKDGYQTAYLWENILQKDMFLKIIESFIQLEKKETTDKFGKKKTKETLIFPRYHQLAAVNKLVDEVRTEGPGKNYLFQHSAGSGKSNTIGWSAHQLSTLHDSNDKKIFDTVIVITDRTVLDEQLKDTISQFSATPGVVVSIDSNNGAKSGQLVEALTGGAMIVVVTLQTFPFILKEIRESASLSKRNFAVIADEAHSSQTGASAGKLRKVLSSNQVEDDGEEESTEDFLAKEVEGRSLPKNVSFLAFTATPKGKTLELFGRPGPDGKPIPFHEYTMKQAIQEGFILDVLQNYTPYKVAYKLAHNGKDWDDKEVDKSEAAKTVARWVRLHPHNISQKVAIIVEHFKANVAWRLNGEAKAMVVTDSRQAAVRYKIEMDKYIQFQGYAKELATLVAFSGDIEDPEYGSEKFTENSMNHLAGMGIREAFATDDYKVLIVANKFQTGFDQPLLVSMYVDKRIDGITAVQTLSRLNRTAPGKDVTYVLDFVNDSETIRKSFEPYYETTELLANTDPNIIYDLDTKLGQAGIYSAQEVTVFVDAYRKDNAKQRDIQAALSAPTSRYKSLFAQAEESDDKEELDRLNLFFKDLGSFCKLYDFLSQIIDYADNDLEAQYLFFRHLEPLIKPSNRKLPLDLAGLEMTHYKIEPEKQISIPLGNDPTATGVKGITGAGTGAAKDPEQVRLEELLNNLNNLFPDITETDRINLFNSAKAKMLENDELRKQAMVNGEEQFRQSPQFEEEMLDNLISSMDSHKSMTTRLLNDDKLRARFKDLLAKSVFSEINIKGIQY